MEVVIHGTKGGYRILYRTSSAMSIATDVRNNVSSEAALGKAAYSIAFASNGCVFTKYIIVRDALRSDATGFIAFSLFLDANKELLNRGADVQAILDELSRHYLDNYVRSYSMNRGETDVIQEDWSFVNDVLRKKVEESKSRVEIEVQPGSKEAALVFYEDDFKLQEYFSKPFQEEYSGYKQILLISDKLRGKSADLLNAIRNSGEELHVDLKNDPYYLNNYSPGRGLSITSNGKLRSDGKKNNVIRAKDRVEIRYEKEYHKFLPVEGVLSNTSSDIYKYIDLKGNQIHINWDALKKDLYPLEKFVYFNIKDWNGKPVNDAHINCESSDEVKSATENIVVFRGGDLGKRWRVSAKDRRFFSDDIEINLKKDQLESRTTIDLNLDKHELWVEAYEDDLHGKRITDSVKIDKKLFTGSEIGQTHKVKVTCRDFEPALIDYCPEKDENPQKVLLKRMKYSNERSSPEPFVVKPGKHGKLKDDREYNSFYRDGSDVQNVIIPNKGYRFDGYEPIGGNLVAQYVKKKYFFQREGFVIACIMGIAFSIIGFLYLLGENDWSIHRLISRFSHDQKQGEKLNLKQVQAYIQGDSLILSHLESYQSLLTEDQNALKDSLENAIRKRKLIDDWNFSELKGMFYHRQQKDFETAIHNIDSSRYEAIKNKLNDISNWTLKRITDSLDTFSNTKAETNLSHAEHVKEKAEGKVKINKEDTVRTNRNQNTDSRSATAPISNGKVTEIIHYLKGDDLKREVLEQYLKENVGSSELKKCIQLCIKFWELDGSRGRSYSSFQLELKKYNVFDDSSLRNFVSSMSDRERPQYPKDVAGVNGGTTNTLQKLKSKISK